MKLSIDESLGIKLLIAAGVFLWAFRGSFGAGLYLQQRKIFYPKGRQSVFDCIERHSGSIQQTNG